MVILVVAASSTSEAMRSMVAEGFSSRGAHIHTTVLGETQEDNDLDNTLSCSLDPAADLIVYLASDITFSDAGGPQLRQVAAWAATRCIPVIALAHHTHISTRELRTVGVEAGYEITCDLDVAQIAQTWVWPSDP